MEIMKFIEIIILINFIISIAILLTYVFLKNTYYTTLERKRKEYQTRNLMRYVIELVLDEEEKNMLDNLLWLYKIDKPNKLLRKIIRENLTRINPDNLY